MSLDTTGQSRQPSRLRGILTYLVVAALGVLGGVVLMDLKSGSDSSVQIFQEGLTDDSYVLVPRLGTFDEDRTAGQVLLVDRDGSVAHSWELPYAIAGYAELQPNGDLIYLGVASEYANGTWKSPAPGEAGVLQRVDWEGNIKWTFEDPLIHHDFAVVDDGNIAILRWRAIADPQSVVGGIPRTDDSLIWGDEIIEITPDGSVVEVWNSDVGMDKERFPIPDVFDRLEWTHANSLSYSNKNPITGDPAYLVSFRQISTLALIGRSSGEIIWEYGGFPLLHQQHDPGLTSTGTIVVFDNGQHRTGPSASKIIELDPRTNEVIWQYSGPGVGGHLFYSALIGGVQRLDSGNTLITEGMAGRLFEVDTNGHIVWEYVNPHVAPDRFSGAENRAVFKARAYPTTNISKLLNAP